MLGKKRKQKETIISKDNKTNLECPQQETCIGFRYNPLSQKGRFSRDGSSVNTQVGSVLFPIHILLCLQSCQYSETPEYGVSGWKTWCVDVFSPTDLKAVLTQAFCWCFWLDLGLLAIRTCSITCVSPGLCFPANLLKWLSTVLRFLLNKLSLLISMHWSGAKILRTRPPSGGHANHWNITGTTGLFIDSARLRSFMQFSEQTYLGVTQHTTAAAALMFRWIWLCEFSWVGDFPEAWRLFALLTSVQHWNPWLSKYWTSTWTLF